jgi:long-chain acyl-CoA synthetase
MRPRYRRFVHDALLASASSAGAHTAIVAEGERISHAALLDAALRLARALQDAGVARGDRVGICLENSVATAIGIYGASLAGAAFMVVNPQTKVDKLRFILRDSGASALLADDATWAAAVGALPDCPDVRCVLVAGDVAARDGVRVLREVLAATPPEPRPTGTIPLDLAALIYTSGSTGDPKGVMMSHQNVVFAQQSLCEYFRLAADDRILNFLPLAFDYGLYQLLMAMELGATLVLERSFVFPAHIVARVNAEGVTVLPGVPTVFATLLALHRRDPIAMPSVRRITNTAAHLPDDYLPGLLEMCPDALVFKNYGLTECKRVAYLDPELVLERPSSVGKAIPGTEVMVLDDRGLPVAPGVTGVLHVRGPHVMIGYWNRPEETAHMLKPGPYPGERVLCTHDLFRIDADGFLYFVGRSDDIIKSRGEKVSPVEVENALSAIPGVREAAVTGVPDEILGEAVRAYVVLDEGASLSEREVRRACAERLESFMVPREVRFVDDLPKTTTGKVRRRDLRERDA